MSGVEIALGAIALAFPVVDSINKCRLVIKDYKEFEHDFEHLMQELTAQKRHCHFWWERLLSLFVEPTDIAHMLVDQNYQRWNDEGFQRIFRAILGPDMDLLISTRISRSLEDISAIFAAYEATRENPIKWITGAKNKMETSIVSLTQYIERIQQIYLRAEYRKPPRPQVTPPSDVKTDRSLANLLVRRQHWLHLNSVIRHHRCGCRFSSPHSFHWPLELTEASRTPEKDSALKLAFVNVTIREGAREWRELVFQRRPRSDSDTF